MKILLRKVQANRNSMAKHLIKLVTCYFEFEDTWSNYLTLKRVEQVLYIFLEYYVSQGGENMIIVKKKTKAVVTAGACSGSWCLWIKMPY